MRRRPHRDDGCGPGARRKTAAPPQHSSVHRIAPTVPAVVLPVVVGLASWALLGLREIGLLIENPFRRSLQLTQCTDALGREIDETLALHR